MKRKNLIIACLAAATFLAACAEDGRDYVSENVGTLKYVEAGRFHRGSGKDNISIVSAFLMGEHEITRRQFLAVMGVDPSDPDYSSGMDDPVQRVNWYHAVAFCNALSMKEGLTPVYSVEGIDFATLNFAEIPIANDPSWNEATADWEADGYRLPTESEWQWAAMGAEDDRSKPFSGSNGENSVDDFAWYYNNAGDEYLDGAWSLADLESNNNRSHPVGSLEPNELGLYDMSGNVWEQCWDRYGQLPNGRVKDYRGAETGTERVYRGGCWHYSDAYCAVAFRYIDKPGFQHYGSGIRVVKN